MVNAYAASDRRGTHVNDDLRLQIRITRKLAESLDGIDLSNVQVGDCVDLPPAAARILILEGWAELLDPAPVEAAVERPDHQAKERTKEPEHEPEPY